MTELQLSNQEALLGFTHKYSITYADLVALGAVASGTVDLQTYVAGIAYRDAAYRLVTAFDGGATSALTFELGYNGATTDDADGLLDGYEVHADATEVLYGLANGADFATLKTGYVALDAGTLQATFAATGGNLNALTAGEIVVLVKRVDLTKL
jgi:hypothetical protein